MTDRYIDLDETQIYGPYSATMIEERVAGLRPEFSSAMLWLAAELVREGCEVRERDAWLAEVCAVQGELAPVLEHSQNARTERRAITPELEAARAAWLETYRAAKLGVECVLRLAGKTHMMPAVFHDLAVPSNAKVTEPPPAPPAEPEDVLGA